MKTPQTMKERVELYFKHRHCLGRKAPSVKSGLLKFADYADKKGHAGPLTISLATEWATQFPNNTRASWTRRLWLVRGFAKYCKAIEPKTEIPPANFYGLPIRRPTPYIYSEKETRDLLDATKLLQPTDGLEPITFKYLLGLLASTGLRISEAIRLTVRDVDLDKGILAIRETKMHKSRYVPLHFTTQQALQAYSSLRDKKVFSNPDSKFFLLDGGRPLIIGNTEVKFRWLREKVGLTKNPRLYDFRHTFACKRLLKWYKERKDIDAMIIYLSTYLGHVRPNDTYWYITATPELLAVASKRFEQCSQGE
jgi:integrase